jgi:hypothetical protein
MPFLALGPLLSLGSKALDYLLHCTICMVASAIVIAWLAGDIHGHRKEATKCRAADIAMQLAAAKRDASIQADTAKLAQQQADELTKVNANLTRKVSDYEASLKSRPGPGCPLTGDDVRRLRDINGQP